MTAASRALGRCLAAVSLTALFAHPAAADEADIHGAGATFPAPLYERWAAAYKLESGVGIDYQAVGSGLGSEWVVRKRVDFGASDEPMAAAERLRAGITQFPAVIGGVVPVVNITGVKSGSLHLNGPVLADIYLGKIRRWNDRAIAELNPGIDLPSSYITVVHRADPSGTTFLWSHYLALSSPQWQAQVGTGQTLDWPIGVAEVGNEGVASAVQRTRVSIGYVEYAYATAHNLSDVAVRNQAGAYVRPGGASFAATAASARWLETADLDQLLIDRPCPGCWPITGASFILVRSSTDQPQRAVQTLRFFDWALKTGGESAARLNYAPVPEAARALIDRLWADELKDASGRSIWPPRDAPKP
jgi:phosphate transport system substrate-binding protein